MRDAVGCCHEGGLPRTVVYYSSLMSRLQLRATLLARGPGHHPDCEGPRVLCAASGASYRRSSRWATLGPVFFQSSTRWEARPMSTSAACAGGALPRTCWRLSRRATTWPLTRQCGTPMPHCWPRRLPPPGTLWPVLISHPILACTLARMPRRRDDCKTRGAVFAQRVRPSFPLATRVSAALRHTLRENCKTLRFAPSMSLSPRGGPPGNVSSGAPLSFHGNHIVD